MKYFLKKLTVIISFMLITFSACTQDKEVEVSKNIVTIKGEKYYIHIIKENENLKKISKAYNLSDREILIENPEILSSWRVGEAIKIKLVPGKNRNLEEIENKDKFIYHVAKNDETLYKIAKIYEIDVSDLIETNPEAATDGIKNGEVLRIKRNKINKIVKKETKIEKYFLHTVDKQESLYMISKIYNVDINFLKMANSGMENGVLKKGTEVKIPITHKSEKNSNFYRDKEDISCEKFIYDSEIFRVALFLPFFLEKNDTVNFYENLEFNLKQKDKKIYKKSKIVLEFYQGCLLAIDSLKKDGVSVDLFVYDTKKSPTKVREILEKSELKEMDLIIGPLYNSTFKSVAIFAKKHKINIVSPFSSNKEILEFNPFVFQITPSYETQLNNYIYFLSNFYQEKIIFIHDTIPEEILAVEKYEKKLYEILEEKNISSDSVIVKIISYNEEKNLLKLALSNSFENIIIIPSKNQAFVSSVVTNLKRYLQEYEITLFGMPQWKDFENVELKYLHSLNLHFFTKNYVDYSSKDVKKFLRKYREVFKSEPTKFSFSGYDVVFYFLKTMKTYGKNFQYCLYKYPGDFVRDGLNYKIKFNKISEYGGFENNYINIIKYDTLFNVIKLN